MKTKRVNDSKEFMAVEFKKAVVSKNCGKCNCSSCGSYKSCGGNCAKCQNS